MCFNISGEKFLKVMIIIPAFILSFALVIGVKKNHNMCVAALITSILMILDIRFGILVMLNIALSIVLKHGDYLKKQTGYPAFNELLIYVDKKNFTN